MMFKFTLVSVAVLGLSVDSDAGCRPGPIRRALARTVQFVRPVAKTESYSRETTTTKYKEFYNLPDYKAIPPKVAASDVEARLSRLEKASTDAGRALLFREGNTKSPPPVAQPAAPAPQSVVTPLVVVPAAAPRAVLAAPMSRPVLFPRRGWAPSASSCPGGNCPNR